MANEPFDIMGAMGNNQNNTTDSTTNIIQDAIAGIEEQQLKHLENIDKNVAEILKRGASWSQGSASDYFREAHDEARAEKASRRSGKRRRWDGKGSSDSYTDGETKYDKTADKFRNLSKKASQQFFDTLEEDILDSIVGFDITKRLDNSLDILADALGVSVEDMGPELGRMFAKNIADKFKSSDLGRRTAQAASPIVSKVSQSAARFVDGTAEFIRYNSKESEEAFRYRTAQNAFNRIGNKSATNTKSGTSTGVNIGQGAAKAFGAEMLTINAQTVVLNAASIALGSQHTAGTDLNKVAGDAHSTSAEDTHNIRESILALSEGKSDSTDGYADAAKSQQLALEQQKTDQAVDAMADVGSEVAANGLSTVISGAATAAGIPIPPELVAVILKPLLDAVFGVVLGYLADAFGPIKEKFNDFKDDISDAFNRTMRSAEKNIDLAQDRLMADVKSLVEEPFEILKDAANEVYDVWDSNLRQINGTQGYTKEDLQSLMGAYASRLRAEGLSSAIGTTDITENLTKVLDAGLSGTIAEEFAYVATKLGAAIPTQDFFGYASTYAQVASQAMQDGLSQSEAIAKANQELETFASGLLYASRELTGGFTTGLTDGSALYQQAVQIAQAAQSDNISQIASVLTSVSAIGGSVAPDLTSGLIDAVYKAAVGGNDSNIVALRSLAGINASNTEFLRQLAKNPQKVFADMFEGLGQMQTMSQDNYMEVAEALSDTFGVSMDALARVDFQYLAENIRSMETSVDSLQENVSHLASGETTTSAEALRMQQINEYMIDEGLAYVLDNEVARSIQEHMWDEQIARELMEATYAVELQGSALSFLQSIFSAVDAIMTILNPFRLISKIADLATTAAQSTALEADIKQTLILGKVGQGQASDLYNLTKRNADLNLTPSYIALQGGLSSYEMLDNFMDVRNFNPLFGGISTGTNGMQAAIQKGLLNLGQGAASSIFSGSRGGGSVYSWGKLSKSGAAALTGTSYATTIASTSGGAGTPSGVSTSSQSAQSAANSRLMELLDQDYLKSNFLDKDPAKGYEDWVIAARAAGFADVSKALSEVGLSEEDVKGQFNSLAAQKGSEIAAQDEEQQRRVWGMLEEKLPAMEELLIAQQEHQTWLQEHLTTYHDWVQNTAFTWMKDTAHEEIKVKWDRMQSAVGDPEKESIQDILGFTAKNNVRYLLQLIQDALTNEEYGIMKAINDFKKEMVDYFVKHVVYNAALGGTEDDPTSWYSKVQRVQQEEKEESSTAIYALADALTSNMVDLKDPQVQTNALLAQILKLVEVITTQNATAGGGQSIADSLIGMALGYTSNTA